MEGPGPGPPQHPPALGLLQDGRPAGRGRGRGGAPVAAPGAGPQPGGHLPAAAQPPVAPGPHWGLRDPPAVPGGPRVPEPPVSPGAAGRAGPLRGRRRHPDPQGDRGGLCPLREPGVHAGRPPQPPRPLQPLWGGRAGGPAGDIGHPPGHRVRHPGRVPGRALPQGPRGQRGAGPGPGGPSGRAAGGQPRHDGGPHAAAHRGAELRPGDAAAARADAAGHGLRRAGHPRGHLQLRGAGAGAAAAAGRGRRALGAAAAPARGPRRPVTEELRSFCATKRLCPEQATVRELSHLVKKLPQYQRELDRFAAHLSLADACVTKYRGGLERLCALEQALALGTVAPGGRPRDPLQLLVPVLLDGATAAWDKVRAVALCGLRHGLSAEGLARLLLRGDVPKGHQRVLGNFQLLGAPLTGHDGQGPPQPPEPPQDPQEAPGWRPRVKGVLEDALEGRLDPEGWPYVTPPPASPSAQEAESARQGPRGRGGAAPGGGGAPRVLLFLLGGATLSETRSAYELGPPALLGSTHIVTPRSFLEDVEGLDRPLPPDD